MNTALIEQRLQEGLRAHHAGNTGVAKRLYQEVLSLHPGHGMAWHLLGALLLGQGQAAESLPAIQKALELAPSAPTWLNYAHALSDLGQHPEALRATMQALHLQPEWADAHHYAGVLSLTLGFPAEALQSFQKALRCNPQHRDALQGMLLPMQYLHELSPEQVAMAHKAWGEQFEHLRPRFKHGARVGRPQRVGLVSGDFCTHPVGNQLRGVLPSLRDAGYALTFYPTRGLRTDDLVTQELRKLGAWVPLHGLSDDAAADRINADGIDVLVDLSGHTGHSRLAVFAQRPAPVQVSWLGYTTTTGMTCFDALLVDRESVPANTPEWFSERLVAMDSPRLVMVPPPHEHPLPQAPHDRPPVFGCFNNMAKLRGPVFALWAELLHAEPAATLFLKGRQFDHQLPRDAVRQGFAAQGIKPERLRIEGFSARNGGYYDAYNDVDVALDPFPFTGGATTLDALWMGVPVVSMVGQTLVSRQGVSLLKAIGHPEWLSSDNASYVETARRLLRERPSRQALRDALMASPAGNPTACARELGAVFERLWTDQSGASPTA